MKELFKDEDGDALLAGTALRESVLLRVEDKHGTWFGGEVRLATPEDRNKLVAALNALEFKPRYVKPGEHTVFTKLSELEFHVQYSVGGQAVVSYGSGNFKLWPGDPATIWSQPPPGATILDLLNKAAGQ